VCLFFVLQVTSLYIYEQQTTYTYSLCECSESLAVFCRVCVLQSAFMCSSVLQFVSCSVFESVCVAECVYVVCCADVFVVCCSVFQCVAVWCSVLQYVLVCCSVL